jgi:hypothetical protein
MDLKLDQNQVIQILNILAQQPYAQVAELIQLIRSQIKPQEVK